jgi:hypothetical protein
MKHYRSDAPTIAAQAHRAIQRRSLRQVRSAPGVAIPTMPLEQVSHVFNSSLVRSAAVQEPSDGGPYKGFYLFRSRRLALTQQALQLDRAQQHAPELVRCLLGIL